MTFVNLIVLSFFKSNILRKRHWFLSILEFLVPVVLFFLTAYGRSKVGNFSQTYVDQPTYGMEISGDQLMANYFSVSETHILYTPTSQFTDTLIKEAQIKLVLPNDAIKGFRNEDDLMKHYAANPNGTVMAIIFNSADENNLDYVIKIHEHYLRWDTNKLYLNLPMYIPETGSQRYRTSGALALQYALDLSYTELLMKGKTLPFYFQFQEFPYPPYKLDTFVSDTFMHFLPLITILSFISLCPVVLKPIVEEKHSGSKELLKMVGMKPSMIYLGWFLHAFITTIISVILIVILMKVSLFGAPYPPIEHCNAFLYFVFLILYCMASIIFCMLLSTFFCRPSVAMVFGILVWIISYFLPHALITNYETLSWKYKILMSFLPNVALYFGYSEMAVYEMREIGINFGTLSTPGTGSYDDLAFSTSLLMFIVQIVLYALLTLYIENVNPGCYGIPKKWDYPLRNLIRFYRKKFGKPTIETIEDSERTLNCVEEGNGLQAGIEIKNLSKRYGHTMAVDKLSLNIYEKQITVLLGHNGAGKTTTMSIVTGMIPATNGSVLINGLDINKDIDQIRKEIGWCPQHNLIFSYFTVFEHLIYFARLRGWSKSEAEKLSLKLLHQLDLIGAKNVLGGNLSGGMKRKLCLALALTGKSKVLILDEPTSGMDPESRREVWNLLLKLRGEKTILITTHFMEEADVLGDWIAIMANGNCICYGTPMYLKKKYDTGYHFSLMLQSNDETIEKIITNQITSRIEDACLKYKNANNLVYILPADEKSKFPTVFKALEDLKIKNQKPINNMAVNITTLEEVFLRTSGGTTTGKESKPTNNAPEEGSLMGKFSALTKKHFWFLKKKWRYQVVPTCIAALLIFLVAFLARGSGGHFGHSEPELKFNLNIYGETSVLYDGVENGRYADMKNIYKQIAESQKASGSEVPALLEAIVEKGKNNLAFYKQHMIVGASFTPERVNIMYSNSAIHGAPISLNMVINTVIRTFIGSGHSVTTRFAPLQGINTAVSPNEQSAVQVGVMWLILVPIAMFFLMGGFLIFPNKEHASKFSALQIMSGVPVWLYWITNFIFDFGIISICSVLLVLILLINPAFAGSLEFGTCLTIFLCFGFSSLPYTYLFSFKKSISGAFALLLMTGMFFGILPTVVVCVMEESQEEWYEDLAKKLKYAFLMLLPQFGLTYTSVKFSRQVVNNYNWKVMSEKKKMLKCATDSMTINPCCYDDDAVECKKYRNYFLNDKFGLFPDILIELLVPFVIYFSLVMLLDSVYWKKLQNFASGLLRACLHRNLHSTNESLVSSKEDSNHLYVKNVSKYFSNKQVVKGVSFAARGGKCFGLLGVNGAGKTTTFRMLTNDIISDNGKIGVHGDQDDIEIETSEYFKRIGYCPQYDALNFDLTARELLVIMAQLRNFNEDQSEKIADDFLDLLDLAQYAHKPCGEFSGGNKRKLSVALALVGCRPYILLDEPTSGVDPLSRRKIWEVIYTLKIMKKVSFILTSHSMDECEALCEDMAIMKDGTIDARGSIPDLKQKHGTGFTLKLKLKSKPDSDHEGTQKCQENLNLMEVDEVNVSSTNIERKQSSSGNSRKVKSSKIPAGNIDSGTDEVDGLDRRNVKYDPLNNGDVVDTNKPEHSRVSELEARMKELFTFELKDKHEGMLHYHIKGEERWSQLFNKVEDFKKEFGDIVEDYTISGTSLEDVFLSVAKTSTKSK